MWSGIEQQLGNPQKAAYYSDYAEKLKVSFNKSTRQGGFWDEEKQCYIHWRDKNYSIHGNNLVTPVNFMAIAYGICDDKNKSIIILDQIEAQMQKENLFFWPICMFSYQGGNDLGEYSSFIYTFAPRLSKGAVTGYTQSTPGGWNIPSKDMIAAYEKGDLRKSVSIGLNFKSPVTGDTVPYINKYNHPHTIYGRTDDNWPVLRYSDVLLMLAEAINEQSGPTSIAYDYLNQVRARAGLVALSGLDKQSFREKVLNERRIELAFENWRWFDLKRTKTPDELVQFLNVYGLREKAKPTVSRQGVPYFNVDFIFESFEILYPIPSNEILVNDKITQNQGY